ncbi:MULTISPECIES: GTPase HflX [unclassified Clostridium]|uniref:GTPase HflX n=1 Tax=Clostridium botulinum (strain Eklund 17B / Type B) TaxID=935198 RepID=B2TML9_CLOBB|nr:MULTISPECIES: GTPase HflX [unclassified Clostridium]ACD23272.1 GTP binding protein [Clostridium botulinum B str. Eklund 17B (NRP)]MBN1054594.1 GTPase HflX [Clostridium botulinum]MBY6975166.1 GTPase HflX [Clostridium botulinum]MBY7000147.1 GTPase HflX [Clostridium botulinum]MCR1274921.1 GTPase HflX [Clostridium botulinum]
MIEGNIDGIRNSILSELEKIHSIRTSKDEVCNIEILNIIAKVSANIEREVSVAINRKGNVTSVAIGDSTSVEVPLIDISEKRLSGVRVIHTHPNGYCNLSALDVTALLKLKLDAIVSVAITEEGEIRDFSLGLLRLYNNKLEYDENMNLSLEEITSINILDKIKFIENLIKVNDVIEEIGEKAILVGSDTKESLEELEELTKACNIPVLQTVFQSRNKIDPSFFIGRGKVLEIASIRQIERANVIIFDDELTGSQVRNLEAALGAKVIDRTTLILEIFATRAKSKEAKIQVELAQLKYRLSRLQGLGTILSRTGGGIGTRGPGEKKLETDRRHIMETIYDLRKELKRIKKTREVQREKRNKESIPKVSLAGYTNAGKSTLRNVLCDLSARKDTVGKEKVFEADMLFATLDTTTRALTLKNKGLITLTDTVGFVRKLPHDLVEAFKSTLEEVIFSDILCHVVDVSSETAIEQYKAVNEVLTELEAIDKETILVLNKIDKATEEQINNFIEFIENDETNKEQVIIKISAKEGINLEEFLSLIEEKLPYNYKKAEYLIPYDKSNMQSFLHRNGRVLEEDYREDGTFMIVEVDDEVYNKTKEYVLNVLS